MLTFEAVHTVDQVLHPAARADFDKYVGELLAAGEEAAARALWKPVVEVRHLPPPEEEPLQIPGMDPISTTVCTTIGCRRCEGGHGGFQFPWIGRWNRSGILVHEGVNPQEAWEAWSASETCLDGLQLGSGQWAFGSLNTLLGTPFAAEKRQAMAPQGVFLGLQHSLTSCLSEGVVRFWAKDKLEEKMLGLMTTAEVSGRLAPGQAAKLYGVANFFEQGIYGRIGCGGLAAVKARQYERQSSLTPALKDCFRILRAIVALRPERAFPVISLSHPRFCVASDAALEEPRSGTGGFLIVWFHDQVEVREAFVSKIPDTLYDWFAPGDHKIAQLELIQVLYALFSRASTFRGRRGIWYIDNLAALMCLIRGRSEVEDLEKLSHLIHVALFSLNVWIYWEWIPSKSNWADAISRLGVTDPWYQNNHFLPFWSSFDIFLLDLPLPAVIAVFQFL